MKYEYRLVRYDRPMFRFALDEIAIEQKINIMVEYGWEVVSFNVQADWGREKSALVLFRREPKK